MLRMNFELRNTNIYETKTFQVSSFAIRRLEGVL
jgi:hypothetical protein